MQQGTANAIGALAGLLAGKVSGDVQQVQQAKQQRALSLAGLQQAIQANPEYAKNPLVQQRIGSIQQGAGTGELFKKMFLGGTPEMANADLMALQNAIGLADQQRQASILNQTFDPAVDFSPSDMNQETAKIFSTYGAPSQLSKNVDYKVGANNANWLVDNAKGVIRQGARGLQSGERGPDGSYNGQVNAVEQAPFGMDPKLIDSLLKAGLSGSVSKQNAATQAQGAMQRTAIQQEGALKRARIAANTAMTNAGIHARTQKELANLRMTPNPQENYQALVRAVTAKNFGTPPTPEQQTALWEAAQAYSAKGKAMPQAFAPSGAQQGADNPFRGAFD